MSKLNILSITEDEIVFTANDTEYFYTVGTDVFDDVVAPAVTFNEDGEVSDVQIQKLNTDSDFCLKFIDASNEQEETCGDEPLFA